MDFIYLLYLKFIYFSQITKEKASFIDYKMTFSDPSFFLFSLLRIKIVDFNSTIVELGITKIIISTPQRNIQMY